MVKGKIFDSSYAALSSATINILTRNDTFSALTHPDGAFSIKIPHVDSFSVMVSMKGFALFQKSYSTTKEQHSLTLLPIILRAEYGDLSPVTVVGVKPIRIKEDTIEFFADAFKVHPGDELEYLLRKFPGLQVMADGTVIYQGRKITRLMLNGRDYIGGSIAMAVQNIPSDIIESIQVVDDYGDKGKLTGIKTGDPDKVINIVLKKNKRDGDFGRVVATPGTKDKHKFELFTNSIRGDRQLSLNAWERDTIGVGKNREKGIAFGYSSPVGKKFSMVGSLSIWGNNNSSNNTTRQVGFQPNFQSLLQQNNYTRGDEIHGGLYYRVEFRPNTQTLFRVVPSVFTNKSSSQNSVTSISSIESDSNLNKTTSSKAINKTNIQETTAKVDVYFEKSSVASRNRLSFLGSLSYSRSSQNLDQMANGFTITDSLKYPSQTNSVFFTDKSLRDFQGDLNYFLSIGRSTLINLGYTLHFSLEKNDMLTQTRDSVTSRLTEVDSLSNNYSLLSMLHTPHVGFMARGQKLSLSMGLYGQTVSRTGQGAIKSTPIRNNYFEVLPNLELSYLFSKSRKLTLTFRGDSYSPSIQQLQPITDVSNPQYPLTGNPFLKPAYFSTGQLHYEQSSAKVDKHPSFGVSLKYIVTGNMIVRKATSVFDSSNIIQKETWVNVSGFSSIGGDYHFVFPYLAHRFIRVSNWGSFFKKQTISLLDSNRFQTRGLNWSERIAIDLDIPHVVEFEIAGDYGVSRTRFWGSQQEPITVHSADWFIQGRHFFFSKWIWSYSMVQLFTNGSSDLLVSKPVTINSTIQRQWFSSNQLSVSFSCHNILDNTSGVFQNVTPTSITQTSSTFTGRYFLFGLIWKFEKIHK